MEELNNYYILTRKNKKGGQFIEFLNIYLEWEGLGWLSYSNSLKFVSGDIQLRFDSGEIKKERNYTYASFQVNELK